MKIRIEAGEVRVRSVSAMLSAAGLIHIRISTPLDKFTSVCLGRLSGSHLVGGAWFCEVYRIGANGAAGGSPTRVILTPESVGELNALENGLEQYDFERWGVDLIGLAPELFDALHVVGSWDRYEPARAEYLDSSGG